MENITIVEMICDILDDIQPSQYHGTLKDLISFVTDRPGHDRRYAIDFTKLRRELNWGPEASFESGIRDTIHWYLDNREWVDRVKSGEYQSWVKKQYG